MLNPACLSKLGYRQRGRLVLCDVFYSRYDFQRWETIQLTKPLNKNKIYYMRTRMPTKLAHSAIINDETKAIVRYKT